jgi:hypothetical protein
MNWVDSVVMAVQAVGLPSTLLLMIFLGGGYIAWKAFQLVIRIGEKHYELVDALQDAVREFREFMREFRNFISEYRADTLSGASCRYDSPAAGTRGRGGRE